VLSPSVKQVDWLFQYVHLIVSTKLLLVVWELWMITSNLNVETSQQAVGHLQLTMLPHANIVFSETTFQIVDLLSIIQPSKSR